MSTSASNIAREGVKAPRSLTLSPAMLDLLSTLVSAIDRRLDLVSSALEEDYEPDTCAACGGTGYLLIPVESRPEEGETSSKG
ncbi:hypothetical protein NMY22_g16619 [Coprinellus aureogranulatus]|nr:hypothetical protein NMY22_g16619 [Coprinellus aureogranulatus]